MLWPKQLLSIGFFLLLISCGYKPIYGPDGSAATLIGKVSIESPSNRADYLLYHQLNNHLQDSDDGFYRLSINIVEISSRAAIDENGRAHRALLQGSASYDLRRMSDQKSVINGIVQGFTGYSTQAASVASHASSRDATKRLMTMLADKIIYELVLASEKGTL